MGAEQIGYILVWPENLSQERLDRANRKVNDLKESLNKLLKEMKSNPGIHRTISREILRVAAELGLEDLQSIEEIQEILDYVQKCSVDDEVVALHAGNYRDVAWRYVKIGRTTRVITFAGEMSWGDAPTGLGYEASRWLTTLDLESIFGIT